MKSPVIMPPSTANTNFAVSTAPKVGGSSMKLALTAEKTSFAYRQKMDKRSPKMMYRKTLQKTMTNSSQDAHSVGLTLMRMKKKKFVLLAVVISFIKDVRCFLQGIGDVITAWIILTKREERFIRSFLTMKLFIFFWFRTWGRTKNEKHWFACYYYLNSLLHFIQLNLMRFYCVNDL